MTGKPQRGGQQSQDEAIVVKGDNLPTPYTQFQLNSVISHAHLLQNIFHTPTHLKFKIETEKRQGKYTKHTGIWRKMSAWMNYNYSGQLK